MTVFHSHLRHIEQAVRSERLKKTDPKFVQRNAAFLLDTLLSLVKKTNYTHVPAYTDALWTKQKCHWKRRVTVRGEFVTVMNDLGPAQSVTISGVTL